MARELSIDVELAGAVEADAAIARLALAFQKAGDSALVAAEKADKFEKAYTQGTARKQATKELDDLRGAATNTSGATDKLTAAVLRYAGPAVMGAAVLKTIAWADNIDEMAKRTRLSVEQVQQLTKVAEKNGSTFQQMAGLIQNVEQRLGSHNKQAEAAVRLMGMAPEALLRMDPLERLRAIAKGLADIKDPAQKSVAELALLGRTGDQAAAALEALGLGADKAETALGPSFIRAGQEAQDVLDGIKNKALEAMRAIILVGPALMIEARKIDEANRQATMAAPQGGIGARFGAIFGGPFDGVISDRIRRETGEIMPPLPSTTNPFAATVPGAPGMPPGYRLLGGPGVVTGSGITIPANRPGGARVLPFTPNQWANISTVLGPANPLGNGGLGSFPGFALPTESLTSSMSRSLLGIGFDRNSQMVPFAPTVAMNAPGATGGGGLGGWLGGHKTQLAGLGLGLASRFIPQGSKLGGMMNLAGQGASMGAMFGPWGMAIGGGLGAIAGLFGGGKAKAEKNARSAETMQVFEQFSSKGFLDLQKQAEKFGISMDKALAAKNMKDFGAAVDEVTAKLQEMNERQEEIAGVQSEIATLTAQSTVTFDQMDRVAKEFGLDINKLGPAFKQAAIDKEAQRIIDAFAIMERGGADVNGVLSGMGDEIGQLVSDSISMGTTIPSNMRPWIEKLHESGQLVDENGQKIRDISTIRYGDPMKSEMQKVVDKLDELITKLGTLTASFTTAKNAANDLANVDYTAPEWSNPGGDAVGMDSGGVAGRDFRRPSYRDVFPALLRRGERVLPPGATGAGVSLSIGNLTVGGGYGSRADAVEDIGDAVVAYLERRGARLVA